MDNWFGYVITFIAGAVISVLYHTGLWWTVKSLQQSRSPVLLSIGSFYLRTTVTVAAFYIVMQNDWKRLVVCLMGFMITKFMITRRIKRVKNV